MKGEEKAAAWIVAVVLAFVLAWISFIVWTVVEVVSWLVTK